MEDEDDKELDALLYGDPTDEVEEPKKWADSKSLVMQAVKKGWPIPDNVKGDIVQSLLAALATATKPREVASITKILASIESQNQSDRHLQVRTHQADELKKSGDTSPDTITVNFPTSGPKRG